MMRAASAHTPAQVVGRAIRPGVRRADLAGSPRHGRAGPRESALM
jgi:hypothetical protein